MPPVKKRRRLLTMEFPVGLQQWTSCVWTPGEETTDVRRVTWLFSHILKIAKMSCILLSLHFCFNLKLPSVFHLVGLIYLICNISLSWSIHIFKARITNETLLLILELISKWHTTKHGYCNNYEAGKYRLKIKICDLILLKTNYKIKTRTDKIYTIVTIMEDGLFKSLREKRMVLSVMLKSCFDQKYT